jgi:hypothetical protein
MDISGAHLSTGHIRQFPHDLELYSPPISSMGDMCQVYRAHAGEKAYAVKLVSHIPTTWIKLMVLSKFLPYRHEPGYQKALGQRGYHLTNEAMEILFYAWHRESCAYEHMEKHIPEWAREYFPVYYGTTTIPFSSCPLSWQHSWAKKKAPAQEGVCAIVLELLEGPRTPSQRPLIISDERLIPERQLNISDESVESASALLDSLDVSTVHVYVHVMEIVEVLHNARVIHGDIRHDAFLDYSVTGAEVMLDFSKSYVYSEDKKIPCLDPFRRSPRTIDERKKGENIAVRSLVERYVCVAIW